MFAECMQSMCQIDQSEGYEVPPSTRQEGPAVPPSRRRPRRGSALAWAGIVWLGSGWLQLRRVLLRLDDADWLRGANWLWLRGVGWLWLRGAGWLWLRAAGWLWLRAAG